MKPLQTHKFPSHTYRYGWLVLLLSFVSYHTWAQDELGYSVDIVERSAPDYPAIDRTITIDANFTGHSNNKQQLQIIEAGLNEIQIQAQLFVNGVKQGDAVMEKNANIQYQGVCHNPVSGQASAIFYVSDNAASVDTSRLIALQFDKLKQQMHAVVATDENYYFGSNFDLLECDAEQLFTPEAGRFKPCRCPIE
ncbi:hypothetical protein QX776_08645 [Alteromonadaceae bacterium BrNp21-10]|nr:hypothetical protein [Alteromonadaceae bacterium BrNp21-10]